MMGNEAVEEAKMYEELPFTTLSELAVDFKLKPGNCVIVKIENRDDCVALAEVISIRKSPACHASGSLNVGTEYLIVRWMYEPQDIFPDRKGYAAQLRFFGKDVSAACQRVIKESGANELFCSKREAVIPVDWVDGVKYLCRFDDRAVIQEVVWPITSFTRYTILIDEHDTIEFEGGRTGPGQTCLDNCLFNGLYNPHQHRQHHCAGCQVWYHDVCLAGGAENLKKAYKMRKIPIDKLKALATTCSVVRGMAGKDGRHWHIVGSGETIEKAIMWYGDEEDGPEVQCPRNWVVLLDDLGPEFWQFGEQNEGRQQMEEIIELSKKYLECRVCGRAI